jgi:hypothetical protein
VRLICSESRTTVERLLAAFVEPSLRSRSSVEAMAEKIESEFPTPDEPVLFINYDFESKAAALPLRR